MELFEHSPKSGIEEITLDVTTDWFWEGNVVNALASSLASKGWKIEGQADTRSKEQGVDLRASKNGTTLLVEAKGSDETSEPVTKYSNGGSVLRLDGGARERPVGADRGRDHPGRLDFNHRPLGYECHHQQNLKTMRGAKSNALLLRTANRHRACPCVALVSCPKSCTIVPALTAASLSELP
jgi:hypothetical protein